MLIPIWRDSHTYTAALKVIGDTQLEIALVTHSWRKISLT